MTTYRSTGTQGSVRVRLRVARRSLALIAAVGSLAAIAVIAALGSGMLDRPVDGTGPEPPHRSNRVLAAQLEIAQGEEPYFVLEPSVPRLRLMCKGVVLREFDVSRVEIGTPAVAFVARRPPPLFSGVVRRLVELDPPRSAPRLEILAPVVGETIEPPVIPLEPSEAQPAPDRYFLRFEGGLTIEVLRDAAEAGGGTETGNALRRRLEDLFDAIRFEPVLRLRIIMPASEAGSLYRSVPASPPLVVL
jgi:hypothetical protein